MSEGRCSLGVVVPTLDEARCLPVLLESLARDPAEAPEELIVVDGGSRDQTRALAAAGGARVLQSAPGRGRQLALGGVEARSEVLLFLHADSRLEPGALAAIRTAFRSPGVVFAGLRQRIDAAARAYRWIEAAANQRVRRGMVYGDSGLCVRREPYLDLGGFRALELFEDLELSQRLRNQHPWAWIEAAELVISARRWEREGILRRSLKNQLLTLAWRLGVDPARLVRYYAKEPAASKSP